MALEYAKAILALPSPLAMQTIPRRGSHAENSFDGPFTSASAIRRELKKGVSARVAAYLPPANRSDIEALLKSGSFTDYDRYGDFVSLKGAS